MKKALSIMFALLLIFLLPACGGDEEEDDWGNDGDGGNGQGNDNEATEWEINLDYSFFQKIAVSLNNEIYVAGSTSHNFYTDAELDATFNPFLLALNTKGEELWGKQWGVPVIHSSNNDVAGLSIDANGNLYIAIIANPAIYKFSPDGTKLWEIFPDLEKISTLTLDNSNNVYIGVSKGDRNDDYIVKYSDQGKLLQSYNIAENSSKETSIRALAVDSNGNIYAGGYTYESLFADNVGNRDAFLVKIASDGTQFWGKQWGREKDDKVMSILLRSDDNIFITSDIGTGEGSMDLFFPDGNKAWSVNQWCKLEAVCSDNSIYCKEGSKINKYNSEGEYLGFCSIDIEKTSYDLACDNNGNIYLGGTNHLIKIPASAIK